MSTFVNPRDVFGDGVIQITNEMYDYCINVNVLMYITKLGGYVWY